MIKNCQNCNKEFSVPLSEIKRGNGKFCSHKCVADLHLKGLAGNRKGAKTSEEHKRKIGLANKGRQYTLSKKWKVKNSVNMGQFWKGKEFSEEHRAKMGLMGEKNPMWKGGITPVNIQIRQSPEMRSWRKAVFGRDNYTCQACWAKNGNGKKIVLNADHIKPFSLFPDLRFDLNNGRTLCLGCHKKTDTYSYKLKKYYAKI